MNSLNHQPLLPNPPPLEAVQLQMDLNIQMGLDLRGAIPTTKVWRTLSRGQKQGVVDALVKFVRVLLDEQVAGEVEIHP